MAVEWYHCVEKAKIKQKNNTKAKQKSSRPNSPKIGQKRTEKRNQKFRGQQQSKKAKFDLFGLV